MITSRRRGMSRGAAHWVCVTLGQRSIFLEEGQMEKETAEALTKSREILAAAAQEGAHVLFAPQSLEVLGRLSPASDDYYDDDAWSKIRDLKG
jgi:hypothetical protein